MTTKYEELANILMDSLESQDIRSNIIVGSTINVKWEDVVTDDFVCFGVINPSGGNNVELNNGLLLTKENITLAIALPNNNMQEYSKAWEALMNAIKSLTTTQHEINGDYYIIADNGRTSNEFLTIRGGKQIAVMMQNLVLGTGAGLLNTKDVTITITAKSQVGQTGAAKTMKGFYNYVVGKQKTFDSFPIRSTQEQKNYVNTLQKTLTIDYYKLSDDALHVLLESDTETFIITLNDGANTILNNIEMHLSSWTQTGVIGNYINCRVSFVDGVV